MATLEASIGWGHYHKCRIEPFLRRFTRAYEYAVRGSDRRQQAVALAWIAIGLVRGPLSVREAIGRCEAMIANDHVPRTLEAQVLLALAELHAMTGRRKLARALLERSTRIMVDLRLDWIAARLTPHAATVELLIGDREAARARLQSGYSVLEAVGAPAKGALLLARLAELAADEGRADEALELAMTCRSLALVDDELAQVRGRAAAARAHALRGEQTPALRLAHHVVRRASRTDEPVLRATAFTALADACLAAGESSDAVAALEAALAEFETKGHLVLARKTRRRLASLRKISSPTGRGRRPG